QDLFARLLGADGTQEGEATLAEAVANPVAAALHGRAPQPAHMKAAQALHGAPADAVEVSFQVDIVHQPLFPDLDAGRGKPGRDEFLGRRGVQQDDAPAEREAGKTIANAAVVAPVGAADREQIEVGARQPAPAAEEDDALAEGLDRAPDHMRIAHEAEVDIRRIVLKQLNVKGITWQCRLQWPR